MTEPEPATVRDPRDLTPDWLTAALAAGGGPAAGVRVRSVRVEPVGTGQMAACYRLAVEAEGAGGAGAPAAGGARSAGAPRLPPTLVAKVPPADTDLGAMAAGAYRNEVGFYARLAPTLAVRAPACHYHAFDEAAAGFTLLLEDMAPAHQGDQVAGCRPDEARAALTNLAGLHGPRWCDPTLAQLPDMAPADAEAAGFLAEVLRSATDTFCDRYDGRLDAADRDVLRAVPEAIAGWTTARAERFAPIHGDYRLDNLLFPDDGGPDVAAVDWQTVGLGLPARDVAYFLQTSLAVDDRRRHEDELVAAYHRALEGHGVAGYPLDRCLDDYRFALLQGPLITVLGAAYSRRTERGDDMFMAMTARSCAAVRDHRTLDLAS